MDYDSGLLHAEKIGLQKGEQIGLQRGEQIGLQKGEQIGLQRGERIGLEKGEDKMGQLMQILAQEKDFAAIQAASTDKVLRESLYRKYRIN